MLVKRDLLGNFFWLKALFVARAFPNLNWLARFLIYDVLKARVLQTCFLKVLILTTIRESERFSAW